MPSTIAEIPSPAIARTTPSRSTFTLKKVNLTCWALFIVLLAAPVTIAMIGEIQNGSLLREDRDFIFFYSMGRMLNQYPPSQLYDFELQKKVAIDVHPLQGDRQYTPNPYPPFVALLFRPFARLPFSGAYQLWLSISFLLYIVGLALAAGQFFPTDPVRRSLIFCLALSFTPFWWIMIGGQISIIGFIGLALAFREEDRRRPVLSGLGLSLCLYKPTLLVLILPMLLVTKRYKTLMGFLGGGMALGAVTTALEGVGVWSGYLRMLLSFGSAATNAHGYRVLHYYMDVFAFSSLLPGGRSWLGGAVLMGCAGWALYSLFRAWRTHRDAGKQTSTLLWAATLTWTFILNLYVPIYDCILPVIGVIASAAVLKDFPDRRVRRQFTLAWALVLAGSWVTIQVAKITGFQMFTILFAMLGIAQLAALGRAASESLRTNGPGRLLTPVAE